MSHDVSLPCLVAAHRSPPSAGPAARAGRSAPPSPEEDRPILTAPFGVESMMWSSRSIAHALGVPQSTVARCWQRTFIDNATELPKQLPCAGLRIHACSVDHRGSVILLRAGPPPTGTPSAYAFARSPLRRALQSLLAADLLAVESSGSSRSTLAAPVTVSVASDLYVVGNSHDLIDQMCSSLPGSLPVQIPRSSWQGLLYELGRRLSPDHVDEWMPIQRRLLEWARNPAEAFIWDASLDRTRDEAHPPTNSRTPRSLRASSQITAAAAFDVIHQAIVRGRLRGGDRITETYLARTIPATRGQVRDGLKVLASQGLVELHPIRGVVVPRPDAEDILETYAARRPLGALLVRRFTQSHSHESLDRLAAAHEAMLDAAKTGDAWSTGDRDLAFQDTLAELTDMRRVPGMFLTLTAQLRLFIAAAGSRYAYSIPDMIRDNETLLAAISVGNVVRALQAWEEKMKAAAQFMVSRTEPGSRPGY